MQATPNGIPHRRGRGAAASARGYRRPVVAYPERIVPDETPAGVVALHLKRYDFARRYCDGADVLDAGCGVGYGAAYLAEVARERRRRRRQRGRDRLRARSATAARTSFRVMDVTALDVRATRRSTSSAPSRRSSTCAIRAPRCARRRASCAPTASTSSRRRTSSGRAPRRRTRSTRRSTRRRLLVAPARGFDERRALRAAAARDAAAPHAAAPRRARPAQAVGDPAPRLGRHRARAPTTDVTLSDVVIERGAIDGASELVAVCRLR